MDAGTGQIVAATPTREEVDDGFQVTRLLDQVAASIASFTANSAYDQDSVTASVAARHLKGAIIVLPRFTAVPSETAETEHTQRDRRPQFIAEHGRTAWQNASGYTAQTQTEATIGRFKQVIGDGRSRSKSQRQSRWNTAGEDRGERRCPRFEPPAEIGTPDLLRVA